MWTARQIPNKFETCFMPKKCYPVTLFKIKKGVSYNNTKFKMLKCLSFFL